MVGIPFHEFLRHVTQETHDVLFPQLTVQTEMHLPRVLDVGHVEVDVGLREDVRVGCAHRHALQTNVAERRVETHTTRGIRDLQSALLFHGGMTDQQ